MKRQRNSESCSTQPLNSAGIIQTSGADIPFTILLEIFLELPTESIVMCKSVCKAWYDMISDPEFARTHLARGKECTLIRNIRKNRISRSLNLFENKDFRLMCCQVNKPVNPRLKIPLRNSQDMLSRLDGVNIDDATFCVGKGDKSKHLIRFKSASDHFYMIANSCNGLLCLTCKDMNSPVVVCNPVTGEFMYLPMSESCNYYPKLIGFGLSTAHNEYKVIRVVSSKLGFFLRAEIHTMGTKSWRNLRSYLDIWKFDEGSLSYPAYLDGALYWIYRKIDEDDSIIYFDLNEERFQTHSIPFKSKFCSDLQVQGGRLQMTDLSEYCGVHVWVMNENGNPNSWTELFSIDFRPHPFGFNLVCCKENEAVVILPRDQDIFCYMDGSKGPNVIQLKFHPISSNFEVVAYTPSFIRMKDIVGLGNVEVLNINSRCGKIKLLEETRPLTVQALKLA